jgi:hypothetical protein
MPVDVRLPIGGLFLSVGLLLLVYGLLSGLSTMVGRLDAGWGAVMIVSGAILGYYGIRSRQRTDTVPEGRGD